jgi:CBS domain-containing protein
MEVREVMSKPPRFIDALEPISKAALVMGATGVGSLLVLRDGELVGIVTDRDLTVRAIGRGLPVSDPVENVMTADVETCRSDTELADALQVMGDQKIRRLPVCSATGDVVGIVSISDLIRNDPDQPEVAETLSRICEPLELHFEEASLA